MELERTAGKLKQETGTSEAAVSSAAFLLSTYNVPGVFTDGGGQRLLGQS